MSKYKVEFLPQDCNSGSCLILTQEFVFIAQGVRPMLILKEHEFCYCHDVNELFEEMTQPYDPEEWCLFIDSSKTSLKAILLHNGNEKPPIPIDHAVNYKETYETISISIKLTKYECHNW